MFPDYEAKIVAHKKKLESIFYDMQFFLALFQKWVTMVP
jgi:hypothetical protein